MRGSRIDLPATIQNDEVNIRETEEGDMHVLFERYGKRFDSPPPFKALLDDLNQSAHWGYPFKGEYRVRHKDDREEVFRGGDVYCVEPGRGNIFGYVDDK